MLCANKIQLAEIRFFVPKEPQVDGGQKGIWHWDKYVFWTQKWQKCSSQRCEILVSSRKINQIATSDPIAASYNVNNRICIMQKVSKQPAEGHKLAQYRLSN